MKFSCNPTGGRKPVDLSATVDDLLAEYVARRKSAREAKQKLRNDVCAALNRFNEVHGPFADEHSTL